MVKELMNKIKTRYTKVEIALYTLGIVLMVTCFGLSFVEPIRAVALFVGFICAGALVAWTYYDSKKEQKECVVKELHDKVIAEDSKEQKKPFKVEIVKSEPTDTPKKKRGRPRKKKA